MTKKVDSIMQRLNDLNPGVPTKTRGSSVDNPVKELNPDVPTKTRGASVDRPVKEVSPPSVNRGKEATLMALMLQNLTAVEKFRVGLFQDAGRIQSIAFESWHQSLDLMYTTLKANYRFWVNLIPGLLLPVTGRGRAQGENNVR